MDAKFLELVAEDTWQIDTRDPEQARYFEERDRLRAAREHELWHWVLTQKMGREFLHTVVFGTLGYLRHIPMIGSEQVYGDVALHNLACTWTGKYLLRHNELYGQMLGEARAREEQERRELNTRRAGWNARRERSDE